MLCFFLCPPNIIIVFTTVIALITITAIVTASTVTVVLGLLVVCSGCFTTINRIQRLYMRVIFVSAIIRAV